MNANIAMQKELRTDFLEAGEKWTDENVFVLDERFYADESEKAEPYPYGFKPTFYRYKLNEYVNYPPPKGSGLLLNGSPD